MINEDIFVPLLYTIVTTTPLMYTACAYSLDGPRPTTVQPEVTATPIVTSALRSTSTVHRSTSTDETAQPITVSVVDNVTGLPSQPTATATTTDSYEFGSKTNSTSSKVDVNGTDANSTTTTSTVSTSIVEVDQPINTDSTAATELPGTDDVTLGPEPDVVTPSGTKVIHGAGEGYAEGSDAPIQTNTVNTDTDGTIVDLEGGHPEHSKILGESCNLHSYFKTTIYIYIYIYIYI